MSARRALLASLLFPLAACGGGSSPVGPGPIPSSGGTQSVNLVVFYDENGNGTLENTEGARVPDVEVSLGGRTGRSAPGTGRAVIDGVPAGTFTPAISSATMPPFYAVGRLPTIQIPLSGDVGIPLVLPIGSNRPNTYMAFGDSLTEGNNYPGDPSYRAPLEDKLRQHFGRATVIGEGLGSTRSDQGALRIDGPLISNRPAYTLILYGTNDWNRSECNSVQKLATSCFTIESLRDIVLSARGSSSLPVLATIPPANEGFDFRAPPQRNDWVAAVDVKIRDLARQEGALLVDLEQAFLAAGNASRLFVDHVHPSAEGEEIIANTFFQAIAHGHLGASVAAFGAPSMVDPFTRLVRPARGRPDRRPLT
jgi:lysophospholipase L1-like esterase